MYALAGACQAAARRLSAAIRYNARAEKRVAHVMQPYLDFMRHVRDHGHRKDDRTGTGTLSVFGHQMRFDLGRGFPLLTIYGMSLNRSSGSKRQHHYGWLQNANLL